MMSTMNNRVAHEAIRVLVVDDGIIHQRLALALLVRHGCAVTLAKNGREAIDEVKNQSFDLILMDVEMPEMDGITATRSIRQREAQSGDRCQVVGVSSSGRQHECIEAGMDDYVAKPLREEALVRLLGRAKASRAGVSAPEPASGAFSPPA